MVAAKAILKGASTSEALRLAGMSPKSDSARASVNALARRALVKAGGTLTKIAKRHVEALDAEESKFFPQLAGVKKLCRCRACGSEWSRESDLVVCPKCESEDWFLTEKTEVPFENVIAHDIRLRAVDAAYKIHDAYPKDETAKPIPGGPAVKLEFVLQTKQTQTGDVTQTRGAVALDFTPMGKGNGGNGDSHA